MLVLFLIDSFALSAVKAQLGKNAPVRRIEETCAALGRMRIASKVPSLLLTLLFEFTANEIVVNIPFLNILSSYIFFSILYYYYIVIIFFF